MKKLLNNSIVLWIILFVSIFIIFNRISVVVNVTQSNRNAKADLKAEKLEYKEIKKQEETLKQGNNSEKYFREEYQMVKDGEILFIFPNE